MVSQSQKTAVQNDRRRLTERGMSRYEIRGLDRDKVLLRQLAARLAAGDAEAERIRGELTREVTGGIPPTGGILVALRRGPLFDDDMDFSRPIVEPRDINL